MFLLHIELHMIACFVIDDLEVHDVNIGVTCCLFEILAYGIKNIYEEDRVVPAENASS